MLEFNIFSKYINFIFVLIFDTPQNSSEIENNVFVVKTTKHEHKYVVILKISRLYTN